MSLFRTTVQKIWTLVQLKRIVDPKMDISEDAIFSQIVHFPTIEQVEKLKQVVDAAELELRGGSMLSDYGTAVKGAQKAGELSLKIWEAGQTFAQSGNAIGETMLGAHALKDSIVEWRKGHYFCCVCVVD
jgi:hypothetical protein